ncbi:hypothetical protein BTN50_0074 [Candidatus Enterovibrio altilux]|uniref:Mobile element protein n=1 Tax=Candidatus Enterovibrio altilux TaxID=1927128 RepID=A0A291B6K2_9GAMM|nr:hypothetical protein BTN50_0074 [Candidatus Enterovibrio luxaltus]
MVRVKKLLGGTVSLGNHTTQTSATDAMIKALNKLTRPDIPNIKAIVQ